MKLTEAHLATIEYTSESTNEVTHRTIVPVSVPSSTVRAIDVSELSEQDQQELAGLVAEYKEYVDQHFNKMFKFEDWAEHSKQIYISPKWRSFKVSGIKGV